MTFFDCWLTFNKCFDEGNFTALTQLVGYKLLAIDNELKHPESFLLTDRELMSRTSIKSGQTIVEARRQLKNAGLIDFKPGKGQKPTRYILKRESSTNTPPIKQESSKNQAQGLVSYTLDSGRRKKDREEADAGVCEGDVAKATKPQVSDTRTLPLSSPTDVDANAIHDEWAKAFGTPLTGNNALTLEQYAGTDYAKTQAAVAKTQAAKPRNPYAYFKTVYDGLTAEDVVKWQAPPTKKTAKIDDAANDELLKLIGGI